MRESLLRERLMATLSGFGALATVLALIGAYGVISCVVLQRSNEIGAPWRSELEKRYVRQI